MTTAANSRRQRQAEQSAAWAVMRADRGFLWLWLAAATALSVSFNIGHAWLSPDAAAPFWQRVSGAAAAPILLMLAIHGLPTLGRMLGRDERDPLLVVVVWGVVSGAFTWSAFGIYRYAIDLGVPSVVAWVAPLTIDLSVFGATRGLVLTAPIAARMKAGLEPAAPAPAKPRGGSTTTDTAPSATAPSAPAPTAEGADRNLTDSSAVPSRVASVAASTATSAPSPTASGAAPTASPQVEEVPHAAPAPSAASDAASGAAPEITAQHRSDAAQLLHDRVVSIPAESAALVLAWLERGASNRRIDTETDIDARTVAKIRKAAAARGTTTTAHPHLSAVR